MSYIDESLLDSWKDDITYIEGFWRCFFENVEVFTRLFVGISGGLLLLIASPFWLPVYLLARKIFANDEGVDDGRQAEFP